MRKLGLFNVLIIIGTSLFSYFIFNSILDYSKTTILHNHFLFAYIINTILAIAIMWSMFILRKKYKDQLGFVFMAGSFIKFGFFFALFYPTYRADGVIERHEFLSFFIPYVTCLITETLTSIRLLNRLDANE